MSNVLTLWVKEELYPTLFHKIDEALPEHSFKRFAGGWRSKTYLDGSPHKDRQDKTVVSKQAPAYILEQGGDVVSLVSYVMKRDKVDFIQAVKTLAKVVGLQPPSLGSNLIAYSKIRDRAQLLEDCNRYFIYCLDSSTYAGNTKEYLSSRGYSSEDIKAMELGFIPSQESLFKYLIEKGYSQTLIDETLNIKTDTRIGSSHRLTIPYRSGGSIKGFKFRYIDGWIDNSPDVKDKFKLPDNAPKYLNSKGLDKSGGFFNLLGIKGDKDIVIVEGELDALHATVKGVENVVATGGSSISPEQIKDAVKRGAKSFTLCFDKDEAGIKATDKAIDVILAEGVNRVYTVTLPDTAGDKTDVDQLIRDKGVEAFKKALAQSIPYYEYRLRSIYSRYAGRELNERDIHNLEDEVVSLSSGLEPLDRDKIIKLFTDQTAVKDWGISKESLEITVDRIRATKDKEAQAKDLKRLLSEATTLQAQGDTTKALELLDKQSKQIKLLDKKTSFNKLLDIPTEEDIKLHFSKHSESLRSGYTINGEELLLPSGGLTGIAGATNHGKTDFLINLTLNAVNNYPEKEFYFFSYEMSQEAILVRFLNTYLDTELEANSNQRAIKTYFKTGSTQYIKKEVRELLVDKTKEFFRDIIGSGRLRVKGVDYYAPELNLALLELNKRGNVGGYFIDYFQLLRTSKSKQSRQEELKDICLDLNQTAKELQLPIILGAQFNREVTTPFLLHATNIGEAGDIERILDTLIGIWNTNKQTVSKDISKAEAQEFNSRGLNQKDKLYTYILKSRETATDVWELLDYSGKRGKIKNSSSSGNAYFE